MISGRREKRPARLLLPLKLMDWPAESTEAGCAGL